jgi:nitrate/nitrite transport system substrate-binding protein
MKEQGMPLPAGDGYRKFTVMKKEFDPAKVDAYVNSFAIRRT